MSQDPLVLSSRPLRLWPAVVLVSVMLGCVWGSVLIVPGTIVQFMCMLWGPVVCGGLLLIWWLFFSRASWPQRITLVLVALGATGVTYKLAHPSFGALGLLVYTLPAASAILLLWLLVTQKRWGSRLHFGLTSAVLAAATLIWSCVRLDGLDGSLVADLSWRWSSTHEDRFLSSLGSKDPERQTRVTAETVPIVAAEGDITDFRGPLRNGIVNGVEIETDWRAHPPKELWRRDIGPGWGTFCVVGDRLFTQEQRGENEAVICYDADTGQLVWIHEYPARFEEVVAGPGPRATPTFSDGRVFALGASGITVCLEATTGNVVWSTDARSGSKAKLPEWGIASSPLIVGGKCIVYSAVPGKDLVALDPQSGTVEWTALTGPLSYSSPQSMDFAEQPLVLMLSSEGLLAVDARTGKDAWRHDWSAGPAARIVQPLVVSDGENAWTIFLGTGYGIGTRNLRVTNDDGKWSTEEIWTSRSLKPYFNDFVYRDGALFGFDGNITTCIDRETGKPHWKRGRYGHGQLVLLEPQGLLLILTERGEVALVSADPSGHRELARMPALHGKTWNHPVVVRGRLYLRNGEEAVCYELPRPPEAPPSTT